MAGAEFWYEFASPYSYPAALRVAALAEARGVSLVWRPFLLGPIFASQGWRDSPFNLYPAKGRYMWRDLERTCEAMGVPFKRPEPFPQPSLLAARVALALEGEERANFSRQVYAAEFGRGLSIDDRTTLASLLAACGVDPAATLERAKATPTRRLSRPSAPGRRRSASSARRRSSPQTARCSGAMIGSNRGSIGRREAVTDSAAGASSRSIGAQRALA